MAIDPGLERVGFAIINKNTQNSVFKCIKSGVFLTSKTLIFEKRLELIYDFISKSIKKFKPKILILERIFFNKNRKTAIAISQSQGVIILAASINKVKIEFLAPLQIKSVLTGYGNSDKKSIQKMINLMKITENTITHDDEADAIACGLAYCYLNNKTVQ